MLLLRDISWGIFTKYWCITLKIVVENLENYHQYFLKNLGETSDVINTTEGLKLRSFTSSNGFSQLLNEPTDIQTNSSSCVDLIFTDKPNLSVNTGVHASSHPNCHHQIVHSSSNLNICYLTHSTISTPNMRLQIGWLN